MRRIQKQRVAAASVAYSDEELDGMTYLPGSDFSKERLEIVMKNLMENRPLHEQLGSKAEDPSAFTGFKADFAKHMVETVTVGDLDSDAKGTGARKSAGKLAMDLIPIKYWQESWYKEVDHAAWFLIDQLRKFQEGSDTALESCFQLYDLTDAVKVLEFGAKKYKAWNWAKGMAWSVPTGCALRHAQAIFDGETIDPDSGESHMGHILCNLMMLDWYVQHYPEGDDRPPV